MNPFDNLFDWVLREIGIEPEEIEKFLSSHKQEARIAANTISISRVVLGYLVIRYYESAREKNDKNRMVMGLAAFTAILASDSMDGYLCRKAHIEGSKSGKLTDSVCDVALRLLIARSTVLSERGRVAAIRSMAELGVAASAMPDIVEGNYSSTDIGKAKIVSDSLTVIASMLAEVRSDKGDEESFFEDLSSKLFLISAVLAVADAIGRAGKKKK